MFPKPKRVKDRKFLDSIQNQPCVACGQPSEPCHIRGKGAGGDDTPDNVIPMCHPHHMEQHHGWAKFLVKNPGVLFKLEELGWRLNRSSNRLERL